ncbi:hypothetical protein B5C34_06210 [Pacificimonas flava]|uniref:Uncharacterized protein n=2 Tax=Pacificimonas TaxID=1960290 RepID=A0A219B412_9SPHN|nr:MULTISPECIES: hypothetical protein [Pacificimonas]MBZ6377181.1 hypothetical protein [Pacificimonas aurantium]OWV33097.1 hypothetical protein B5C34_06210 [Pacificimonas flava]
MPKWMRPEMLMAIAAFVTSIAAVWVAWEQSRLMRVQQHASMRPILTTAAGMNAGQLTFHVANVGVGPALVRSAELAFGSEGTADWTAYRQKLFPELDEGVIAVVNVDAIEGRPIAAGESFSALTLQVREEARTPEVFRQFFSRFRSAEEWPNLRICYCSVFDRCWTTEVSGEAAPVKECPAPTNWQSAPLASMAAVSGEPVPGRAGPGVPGTTPDAIPQASPD